MSIAGAILDATLRHAAGRRVSIVHVRIGHLRQVVPGALSFAWQLATMDTDADGSELDIEVVPITLRCRMCGAETERAAFPLACGSCGGLNVEVARGEELEIEWLEVAEADDAAEADRGTTAAEKGAVP